MPPRRSLLRRKWRWFACLAIAAIAIAASVIGPTVVQLLAFLIGLFSILIIILSGVDGSEGKIPPWYGGSSGGGGGGGSGLM